MKIAILIDGAFFIKRYRSLHHGNHDFQKYDARKTATDLYSIVMDHVGKHSLYRILYYDCPPFEKKVMNPISRKEIDFSTTDEAKFRCELFEQLKHKRKMALRLGHLKDNDTWEILPAIMKKLLANKVKLSDLNESNVKYSIRQKGVDIKIGCDIAALAYKHLVDRIVLISGDCDLVPAVKVARREGIDFIIDPMWNPIDPSLLEHADGIKSSGPNPRGITKVEDTPGSKYKID